jgi:PLD-like domain
MMFAMRTVLGRLNGEWLANILNDSRGTCTGLDMAVAYADVYEPLERYLRDATVPVRFFGRWDSGFPVSAALLRWFIEKAPTNVRCFLVNGPYHPKVIWWRGFGAYIGSANLTKHGWERNIECGVFLSDDELYEQRVATDLEAMFAEISGASFEVGRDDLPDIDRLARLRSKLLPEMKALDDEFQRLFGKRKAYRGPTYQLRASEAPSVARVQFVDEWSKTLELMRRLARRFAELSLRPSWVPADTDATTHFDQLLHGYYYHQVIRGDVEGRKSKVKVDAYFDQNRRRSDEALVTAARWWAALSEPPTRSSTYNEARFITEVAPRLRKSLSAQVLPALDEASFVEVMSAVNAFRDHGRRVDNATLGLKPGTELNEDQRIELFAAWMYRQRSSIGRTPLNALMFVIHDSSIRRAEDRIWAAIREPAWRIPRLGKSTLGEVLGWARPNDYPPRNDRTNKALRALGHDVIVFDD